ncbi:MAG: zf-HC2 domain-containing protein [Deltaproteobacteria bacterium]|nr:zf-HC2 domain-containing protein [Deltaproteobacteria bacterium]
MPSCREITELLTDYAEGRLGLVHWLRLQLHLGMCSPCRAYLRQLRATAGALGKLPSPEVPADLQAELMRRFEGWKDRR